MVDGIAVLVVSSAVWFATGAASALSSARGSTPFSLKRIPPKAALKNVAIKTAAISTKLFFRGRRTVVCRPLSV